MLTSKIPGLALAAVLATAMAGPAMAQAPKDPRLATFKANDKNKDGKLAKEEFSVVARSYGFGDKVDAVFPQSDKNKDSFLQDTEFLAALDAGNKLSTQVVTAAASEMTIGGPPPAAALAALFKGQDKDNDGKLNKAEFIAFLKAKPGDAKAEAAFKDADKNKDGFVTQAEFAPSGGGPVRVFSTSGGAGNAPPPVKVLMAFKTYDANKDGKLAKDEYQALVKAENLAADADGVWTAANKDKDTFITESELVALLGATPGMQVMRAPVGAAGTPTGAPVAAATDEQRFAAFKAQDRNKDGKLAKAEYAEVLKVLGFADQLENYWTLRDANRDGFITEAEYEAPIGGGQVVTAPRGN